jgi:hypothetical protein
MNLIRQPTCTQRVHLLSGLFCIMACSTAWGVDIIRGPYLQNQSPTTITVRWRTDEPTESTLWWGSQPGQLKHTVSSKPLTTEHSLTIDGLQPGQAHHYAVGYQQTILAGNDLDHRFNSPPVHGSTAPVRFWVLGDSGTANANAAAVRDAYVQFAGPSTTHLWFMLGDNAYGQGTDEQYQAAVFDMYPQLLRQATLWPAIGNHDAVSADPSSGTGVYFDLFTLPTQATTTGHSLGADSGTEAYYSFNFANIHFIVLESNDSLATYRQAQLNWLEHDLMLNQSTWTIALWHHPPYTKGSHDSDTEVKHIYMRENIIPILESHDVDLVLGGHSHSFERSWLIDGHYGHSSTFSASHIISGVSGDPLVDAAYLKPPSGGLPHQGAVYVVAGSSGKVGQIQPEPHPAMRNNAAHRALGSLVVDVSGERLTVRFLNANGAVDDVFTILKNDLIVVHDFEPVVHHQP